MVRKETEKQKAKAIPELFTKPEKSDLVKIGKRLAEYLHTQNISRIAFLDVGARPAHSCLVEAWRRMYPSEKTPDVYFFNPLGFHTQENMDAPVPPYAVPRLEVLAGKGIEITNDLTNRTQEVVKTDFTKTYPNLLLDKKSPVLIFDTCQHSGISTAPIYEVLESLGFEDIRLGLASDINDHSPINPDFVALKGEANAACYPFGTDGLADKSPTSFLATAKRGEKNRLRGLWVRGNIRKAFADLWDVIPETATLSPTFVERLGFPKETIITNPLVLELFYAGTPQSTLLPTELATNPKLLEQAEQRRRLHSELTEVFQKIKDPLMEWDEAIEQKIVTKAQVEYIYLELTTLLEQDPNHARILLYLPVEMLLQNASSRTIDSEIFVRFLKVFQTAWLFQLAESEFKSNYIDGDTPEPELERGPIPRVRKAAHLIPELLRKNWIQFSLIARVLEVVDDQELEQSIFEGIQVAFDQKIIGTREIELLEDSKKNSVSLAAQAILDRDTVRQNDKDITFTSETIQKISIENFSKNLVQKIQDHAQRYDRASPFVRNMTPNRYSWEKSDRYEKILDTSALELARQVAHQNITFEDAIEETESSFDKKVFTRIVIKALYLYLEKYCEVDSRTEFYQKYSDFLEEQWNVYEDVSIREDLYSCWSKLIDLEILDETYLQKFNLKPAKLSEPSALNLKELAQNQLLPTKDALTQIQTDDEYAQAFHQGFILSGSLVKGYDRLSSDGDILALSKKGARSQVGYQEMLSKVAQLCTGDDTMLTIEMDSAEGVSSMLPNLNFDEIRDFVQGVVGGVWIGNASVISKMYGQLLHDLLYLDWIQENTDSLAHSQDQHNQKELIHMQLLRSLEADTLQYRLLHRGYKFFHAEKKPARFENAEPIDGNTTFWDSGYRRVATLTYLSKVFLPNLSGE